MCLSRGHKVGKASDNPYPNQTDETSRQIWDKGFHDKVPKFWSFLFANGVLTVTIKVELSTMICVRSLWSSFAFLPAEPEYISSMEGKTLYSEQMVSGKHETIEGEIQS